MEKVSIASVSSKLTLFTRPTLPKHCTTHTVRHHSRPRQYGMCNTTHQDLPWVGLEPRCLIIWTLHKRAITRKLQVWHTHQWVGLELHCVLTSTILSSQDCTASRLDLRRSRSISILALSPAQKYGAEGASYSAPVHCMCRRIMAGSHTQGGCPIGLAQARLLYAAALGVHNVICSYT